MKMVRYEDVPAMCDEILEDVEMTGTWYEIHKNGRSCARSEPVDETTKAQYEAESAA